MVYLFCFQIQKVFKTVSCLIVMAGRDGSKGTIFPCLHRNCISSFSNKSSLLKHLKLHEGRLPWRCTHLLRGKKKCPFAAAYKSLVVRHVRSIHFGFSAQKVKNMKINDDDAVMYATKVTETPSPHTQIAGKGERKRQKKKKKNDVLEMAPKLIEAFEPQTEEEFLRTSSAFAVSDANVSCTVELDSKG